LGHGGGRGEKGRLKEKERFGERKSDLKGGEGKRMKLRATGVDTENST